MNKVGVSVNQQGLQALAQNCRYFFLILIPLSLKTYSLLNNEVLTRDLSSLGFHLPFFVCLFWRGFLACLFLVQPFSFFFSSSDKTHFSSSFGAATGFCWPNLFVCILRFPLGSVCSQIYLESFFSVVLGTHQHYVFMSFAIQDLR